MQAILMDAIGWVGAVLVMGSYAMISAKKVTSSSLTYQWMNIIGGTMLGINTFYYGAIPSAIVNVVWVLIGILAILAIVRTKQQ